MQTLAKTSPQPTILIAGNGAETAGRLNASASPESYDVRAVQDGATALLMLARVCPSLIVLDVELAKVSWMDFYRLIRNDAVLARTPVLILTDSADDVYKLTDFGPGNTDFAVKPFTPQELILRMRRLLYARQITDIDTGIMMYDDLQLDVARHEVVVEGNQVHLTATEFRLLTTLAQRHGRVQPRERLLQDVFAYNTSFLETRTVDTHVRRLRGKLGQAKWRLETVRGVGYRFCEKPALRRCESKQPVQQLKRPAPPSSTARRRHHRIDMVT
jgi:two-component system phosphate regulon response regulator PhoB